MPDFASALQVLVARGLQLNNLFQLEGGLWRASVRTSGPLGEAKYWDFAESAEASEAILKAAAVAEREPGEGAYKAQETMISLEEFGLE